MIESKDLQFFFGELIAKVIFDKNRKYLKGDTEVYLTGIMVDMSSKSLNKEPLCFRIYEPRDPRFIILKEAADESLFISGFFADSLRYRGMEKKYYAALGSTAYSELSLRSPKNLKDVFCKMASMFQALQMTLHDVRDDLNVQGLDTMIKFDNHSRGDLGTVREGGG